MSSRIESQVQIVEMDSSPLKAVVDSSDDAGRQRRLLAVSKIFGLWKYRPDTPKNGLQYQEEIRAEW